MRSYLWVASSRYWTTASSWLLRRSIRHLSMWQTLPVITHCYSNTNGSIHSFCWINYCLAKIIYTLITMPLETSFWIVGMQFLPGISIIGIVRRMELCWRSMTQYLSNDRPSTQALMTAVRNVLAVVPSSMMTTYSHPRNHRWDYLGDLHLQLFPLSTITFLCRWVNGRLIRHSLWDRCSMTSKLPQSHILYWSSLQYRKIQYCRKK